MEGHLPAVPWFLGHRVDVERARQGAVEVSGSCGSGNSGNLELLK